MIGTPPIRTIAMTTLVACLLWAPQTASAKSTIEFTERTELAADGLRYLEGTYPVAGQPRVHFTVYAPAEAGRYHAMLFLHGYEKSDLEWAIHQTMIAKRGLIALAIDYNERESQEHYLNEVTAAVRLLQRTGAVKTVSLCGTSWGGRVAFETIAIYPELDISSAFLVYPTKPHVLDEHVAAVEAHVLHCVGELDPTLPASEWLANKIDLHNDKMNYRLHIYSAEDFPREARHGYFFARHRSEFNEVAIDSFVRSLGLFMWKVDNKDCPEWIEDPELLTREDLVGFPEL